MRIAYICADPGIPVYGRKGCSIHVQEVIRAMLAAGADVELFATRIDGPPPRELETVRVHPLEPVPKGELAERERLALRANDSLLDALGRRGPFDLVYERYSLWSYSGMEYARAHRLPGVIEVNAPLIEEQTRWRGMADPGAAIDVARRAFASASVVIAVSEEVARYVRDFDSTSPRRIHVIPNAVDASRFQRLPAAALPAENGIVTVGFVGMMRPWHGVGALVEAFTELHRGAAQTRLLLVGDGQEREAVEAEIASRALQKAVVLTGKVDHDAVPGLLASMDIATAPYPAAQFYFSPLKLFEYMAAGLAIVASDLGQIARLLRHERTALLCPPGDAAALAAALRRLVEDAPLRDRLGGAARRLALEHYTWDRVVGQVFRLAGIDASGSPAAEVVAAS